MLGVWQMTRMVEEEIGGCVDDAQRPHENSWMYRRASHMAWHV